MYDFIGRSIHWLRLVLAPGAGRHRPGPRLAALMLPPWPGTADPSALRLPTHRSPYSQAGPLDGGTSALARPYLVAHEQERARQGRRRLALVLAADFGVDLDRHLIGARTVAA
ncbi:hypothetical protein AB0436_15860 [Streptomyces sp. NPDC051322]|uniref:hypothetical protein n=1 Tax=Streptomyces sp. NPDC051322 TaxID=3154645 RepID=UPI00344B15EE